VDVADVKEVVIDSIHSVAIRCHEAAEFTSEELGLQALVSEGEGSEKCFPNLLGAQKGIRAVVV
jgi:hypothetical protein